MGCGHSSANTFIPNFKQGQSISVLHMALELGFIASDVHKLYRYFRICDADNSGKCEYRLRCSNNF